EAEFRFVDLATNERWSVTFSDGRFPWWIFDKSSRVPDTRVVDYLPFARLAFTSQDRTLGETIDCSSPIYQRLLEPIMLAALNIAPRDGSAKLASAVIRETIARGGQTCRPLLARDGIGNALVEPAVACLRDRGVVIQFQDELLGLKFAGGQVSQVELSSGSVTLGSDDGVILAVPPYIASRLVPDLRTPTEFRGILNAHFNVKTPDGLPRMLGVLNGTVEWVFVMPGHVSVTISDAGRFFEVPREEMAQRIWGDVTQVTGLPGELPPWQIVRERRATFAATPEQNALRPPAQTAWSNLLLAGDWTATGLPATLESAIRSGFKAADLAISRERMAA
ncbi:MAG: FAD-dependent oxidoreductase, partial [Pseudolabrys sp.]|nr:FAD-dependent oxidoreductase [Pseudolabrys sp.]